MHDCIIYMLQNRRFVVANYERVFPKQYHMTVDTFLHQALQLLFTSFLVEHNIPLSASDHAGLLFRKMFPDSELAKKYGSARTKTTCTISALARSSHSNVVSALERQPFSVSTDGSNDSDFKLYPIVVRYQNSVTGRVDCTLLSLPSS